MQPHGYLSFSMSAAQINGQSWDPKTPYDVLEFDKVYEVEISGSGAHPFHLHLYHMQVMTLGGCQDHEEGQFYDTISARGTCTVRFSTRDIGGRTVYHCHVLGHEDNGSMGWVDVQNAPPVSTDDMDEIIGCAASCIPSTCTPTDTSIECGTDLDGSDNCGDSCTVDLLCQSGEICDAGAGTCVQEPSCASSGDKCSKEPCCDGLTCDNSGGGPSRCA
jgi:hypothetical protein